MLLGEAFTAQDVARLDPALFKHRILPLLEPGGVEAMEAITCGPLFFVAAAPTSEADDAPFLPSAAGAPPRWVSRNWPGGQHT